MGTTYSINIYDSNLNIDILKFSIDSLLNHINSQMSTYDTNSELSLLNNSKSGSYAVSSNMYKVLDKALAYCNLDKKYDITILPLIELWGFNSKNEIKIPSENQIINSLQNIGCNKIELNNNKVIKKNDNMKIDLNSIAKGYAVDELSMFLSNAGYNDHLVEVGGELRSSGINYDWIVGIKNPINGEIYQSIKLINKSIATSGPYNNFFEINGMKYSHLINPINGYPIRHNTISVSVVADNCIDADALATLVMIYENPYEAINLINKIIGVEALILLLDEDDELIEILSNEYNDLF